MEKIGVTVLMLLAHSSLIKGQQTLLDNSKIENTTNKNKIYLAAFFLNVEKDTYSFRAGMEVARRLINEDDRILKDYEIVIHYHNSLVRRLDFKFLLQIVHSLPAFRDLTLFFLGRRNWLWRILL